MTLDAIAKPDVPMDTLMDPLKAGLEHEEYVTSLFMRCMLPRRRGTITAPCSSSIGL